MANDAVEGVDSDGDSNEDIDDENRSVHSSTSDARQVLDDLLDVEGKLLSELLAASQHYMLAYRRVI